MVKNHFLLLQSTTIKTVLNTGKMASQFEGILLESFPYFMITVRSISKLSVSTVKLAKLLGRACS